MITNYLPQLPVPILLIGLPLLASLPLLGVEGIRYLFRISGRKPLELGVRALKTFFFTVVAISVLLSMLLWHQLQDVRSASHILSGSGWTTTLAGVGHSAVRSNIQVDIFSATAALSASIVALAACLRAMANKAYPLTVEKVACYFLTFGGVLGIYFAGGIFNLLIATTISQVGASWLARPLYRERSKLAMSITYFISRFLLLVMILAGVSILALRYDIYSFSAMAQALRIGGAEKAAFALLAAPFLYLFIKPPIYTADPSCRIHFAMRAHAAFFAFFKITFFLYGAMEGFERIPVLIGAIGITSVFTALLFAAGEREPIKFAAAAEGVMKGFMLVSLSLCLGGIYVVAALAEYGYVALEALTSLWLLFLPVSAVLSITAAHLLQEVDGNRLWLSGGHIGELGFTGLLFALAIFVLCGVPPFTGFPAMQFFFRSANGLNPLLMAALFAASLFILFAGIRNIGAILFGKNSTAPGTFSGDSAVALPLALLFITLNLGTVMPGAYYESVASPSVNYIMNTVRHVANVEVGTEEGQEKEAGNDTSWLDALTGEDGLTETTGAGMAMRSPRMMLL